MAKSIKIGSGIDSIPTSTIPDDPTQFTSWFKNIYLKRWAANADVRNATPGAGIKISGSLDTPGFVGLGETDPLSVIGNPTGVKADVQDIIASADGEYLQRESGALVWAPVSISVNDSISGNGSSTSPLQLSGDAAVPGNTQYYGTDAFGIKGYHPLSLTSPAVPGTIPDLIVWWASDNILAAPGAIVQKWQDKIPWTTGVLATTLASVSVANMPIVDSAQLNSLPIVKWPAGSFQNPQFVTPTCFTGGASTVATFFAVVKPNTGATTGTQALIGSSASGGLGLYMQSVASVAKVGLVKTNLAVIGSSTATWASGAAFQFNVTYNATSGAFAFRQARTSAGSGTGATAAGNAAGLNTLGTELGAGQLISHSIAELIVYDRVLSSTEITNVENYLLAKWGV